MTSTLVLFFLQIQSSYAENREAPATEDRFDTVQFYEGPSGCWRIKTFAMDQDVHVWSMGASVRNLVELARANTEKHYGDVLSEGYIVQSDDAVEGLRQKLKEKGLPAHLEISDAGFLFWAPEGTRYRSKSRPNN
ncbi:MAG: hypothetical protein L6R28_14680 [Planctomycetes bacterium]|nr:hypothetical protein [Planctomycetota bacterium]